MSASVNLVETLSGVRTGGPDVRALLVGCDRSLTVEFSDGIARVDESDLDRFDLKLEHSGPLAHLLSQRAESSEITTGQGRLMPPLGLYVEAPLDHVNEPVLIQHVLYDSFIGVVRMHDIVSNSGIHRHVGSKPRADVVVRSQYGLLSQSLAARGFRPHFGQSQFTARSVGALMTAAQAYEHLADRLFSDVEVRTWRHCGRLSQNVRSSAWRTAIKRAVQEVVRVGT